MLFALRVTLFCAVYSSSCLHPVSLFGCNIQTYFMWLKLQTTWRLQKGCKSSKEETREQRDHRSCDAWKIHFVWMGLRGHKSPAFAHLLKVKQKQSPESLKCKNWDIYTPLPWGRAHLSCWSNSYASDCPRSYTCTWYKGEGNRSYIDSPTVHCVNLIEPSKSCNVDTVCCPIATIILDSTAGNGVTINGCSSPAPRV